VSYHFTLPVGTVFSFHWLLTLATGDRLPVSRLDEKYESSQT
jgi:hypothetical protein